MRVLGIETSTRRGSVALVEDGRVVVQLGHEQPNAHAEEISRLVSEMFAQSSWARSSIDRVGVGVGPGAFTGIRVGIALAQGIALGLGRPLFGVGSLEAMARAVPAGSAGLRLPLLDARRDEVFVAAYDAQAIEHAPARAVARDRVLAELDALAPGPRVILGEIAPALGLEGALRSAATDLPDAAWTARIALSRDPTQTGASPHYVRDAGATRPELPPSPFSK